MITHKIFLRKKHFFNGKSHLCGICHNFILQVLLPVEMKANLKCMDYLGIKLLVFLFLTTLIASPSYIFYCGYLFYQV